MRIADEQPESRPFEAPPRGEGRVTREKVTQRLARLGTPPDAGRYRHVCIESGRLDRPALRGGIMVSKMPWLRYARENGYGVVAKTPAAAVPAADVDYHCTGYLPLPVAVRRRCR